MMTLTQERKWHSQGGELWGPKRVIIAWKKTSSQSRPEQGVFPDSLQLRTSTQGRTRSWLYLYDYKLRLSLKRNIVIFLFRVWDQCFWMDPVVIRCCVNHPPLPTHRYYSVEMPELCEQNCLLQSRFWCPEWPKQGGRWLSKCFFSQFTHFCLVIADGSFPSRPPASSIIQWETWIDDFLRYPCL